MLARRDFASAELRKRLEDSGFAPSIAAEAVGELSAGRILDDARYCEHFVGYHAERGQGPVRIAVELRARGVEESLIDAALAAGPDWHARAREVRIRKFGLAAPQDWPTRGRQARFLQYRGFSADHIRSALGADVDPDQAS